MTSTNPAGSPDACIARLASRHHGLVTLRQLLDVGLTAGEVRWRIRTGALTRCKPGVFRVAGAPRTWEQRALEACLVAGSGSVLWARSAATLWRFDLPVPTSVDVAVAHERGGRPFRRDDVVVHRVRCLDSRDVTEVGGLAVTTPARTLVELSACLQPAVVARVLDDAFAKRLSSPARVEDVLARIGGRGRRGIAAVRRALAPWLAGAELESAAEADCLRAIAAAGLAPPAPQFVVQTPDGVLARLDFAWPAARLALEVDGFRWHATAASHEQDSHRANLLASLGWTVLRVTPTELAARPGAILEALRRRLEGVGE